MKRILVAIDGSENSKKALIKAKEVASFSNSDVFILTVVENHKGNPIAAEEENYINTYKSNILIVEEILKEALEVFKDFNGNVKACYRVGDIAEKIIEFVEENNIDLIVMGRRGLGTFSRAFLGSISNKVLNNVKTSVLIVK